ncbi:GerAB/ArcD/ProY family transporter [Bacillus sp. Marseille-P3661]|uniref:GerAB/ArcD/ProY family transporter n=1 Tax=Bacillus sp. Marseille-P3661 TaxID=1936234 RepID=UPI000C86744C|nr:endospore germination permease [Bacillus sp. Marseille-P3661]
MDAQKQRITGLQLNILIILYTVGSSILFIPAHLASFAKQNGWIAAIGSTLFALVIQLFIIKFTKLYPEKDLIECCELSFGKWIGNTINILLLFFSFTLSVLTLWSIGDFMVTMVMPDTPIHAIFILFVGVVIYGVRLGLEPIARAAEIFIPWVIGLALIIIVLLFPVVEVDNISPVFEGGIRPILAGMYYMIGFPFLELVLFLMITPRLNNKESMTKSVMIGTVVGGIILAIITLLCILVLGPDFTARNSYPAYVLGKKISIGNFLERIEILIAVLWILSIYFKLAITFYIVCVGTAKLFSLKNYRSLTIPFGMLIITLTLIMIPDTVFLLEFTKKASMPFKLTFVIILLIVYMRLKAIKNKSKQASNQKNQAL